VTRAAYGGCPHIGSQEECVDAATVSAIGVIGVGLATAVGALIGKRGENRVGSTGAVLTSYDALVNNLQEERDRATGKLAETDRLLAAAYAELAGERADKAALQGQINALTAEKSRLLQRIADLGGQPP
jgi:enoyl-CoA hydratase/carnithine racemase